MTSERKPGEPQNVDETAGETPPAAPVERPRNMPRPRRRHDDAALRSDRRGPGGYDTKG